MACLIPDLGVKIFTIGGKDSAAPLLRPACIHLESSVLNGPVQVLFLGIVFSEQRKLTACNLCDLMLAEKAKYPAGYSRSRIHCRPTNTLEVLQL